MILSPGGPATAGFTAGYLDSAFGVTGDNVNKVTHGFELSKVGGSQYKIFTRLRGLLRETKSTGSNTATLISSSTRAARAIDGFSEVHWLG